MLDRIPWLQGVERFLGEWKFPGADRREQCVCAFSAHIRIDALRTGDVSEKVDEATQPQISARGHELIKVGADNATHTRTATEALSLTSAYVTLEVGFDPGAGTTDRPCQFVASGEHAVLVAASTACAVRVRRVGEADPANGPFGPPHTDLRHVGALAPRARKRAD